MIYDHTGKLPSDPPASYGVGSAGYAIHEQSTDEPYSLYTDDGHGNGDFVVESSDIYWIRRIAFLLDLSDPRDFDSCGFFRDVIPNVGRPFTGRKPDA